MRETSRSDDPALAETSTRDAKMRATRARIADTALELFASQGYAQTTIDQISAVSGISRRTIFRYFPTKEAMLFDHFAVQRDVALGHLEESPLSEPPLVSLHAVLRAMCDEGFERRAFAQIRTILDAEPQIASKVISVGIEAFEQQVIATLARRSGPQNTALENRMVTLMATAWFATAAHIYLVEDRQSLLATFDEVVAAARSSVRDLGDALSD